MRVAPFAGAWIEIVFRSKIFRRMGVAPFAGAWIEIQIVFKLWHSLHGRTLRGCVD